MRKTILLGILVVSICSLLPVWGQSVFIVDRLTDTGDGEGLMGDLRYCITNTVGGDAIIFDVMGTINLTRALPDLTRSISIEGPGANLLTVRRNSSTDYRIFTVASSAAVSISGLRIADGGRGIDGGGIYNGGTLTVSNSTISGNTADWGGAGGGIYNGGTLTVSNSTISGNSSGSGSAPPSDGRGGGIYNNGTLTASNSTISGNAAESGVWCPDICYWGSASGGGIYNNGPLTVSNSTISGNRAEAWGPEWAAGRGIFAARALGMRNTILAGNSVPLPSNGPDISGTLSSSGYNLIGNTSGGSGFDPTDLLNVNPMLGSLQDNGGSTLTHALLPGSPAIDAGDPDFVGPPEYDQRGEGFPRIVRIIDIGAFEVQKDAETTGRGPGHRAIK